MLENRAQPAEKKSECNTQRHFRFPAYAFTKDDGNFAYAQRSAGAHHCLENNFEPAGWRDKSKQTRTTDRKEAAHRIVQASERIGKHCACSRHSPAPYWPAGGRSALHIAASNHKVCCIGEQRRHQIYDSISRMTQVGVHHKKNFSLCGSAAAHYFPP